MSMYDLLVGIRCERVYLFCANVPIYFITLQYLLKLLQGTVKHCSKREHGHKIRRIKLAFFVISIDKLLQSQSQNNRKCKFQFFHVILQWVKMLWRPVWSPNFTSCINTWYKNCKVMVNIIHAIETSSDHSYIVKGYLRYKMITS